MYKLFYNMFKMNKDFLTTVWTLYYLNFYQNTEFWKKRILRTYISNVEVEEMPVYLKKIKIERGQLRGR